MSRPGYCIILLGPPGVGKGAQAQLLGQHYRMGFLSTGDILRDEIARGTDLGVRVRDSVAHGAYVADDVVLGVVAFRLDLPQYRDGLAIDGFPRTLRQAEEFDRLLGERGRRVDFAFQFTASEDTLLKRMGGRRVCTSCGATYHEAFKPPRIPGLCDVCRGRVIARQDDDPLAHRQRIAAYSEHAAALFDHYFRSGVAFEVNGDQSIEHVNAEIRRRVDAR